MPLRGATGSEQWADLLAQQVLGKAARTATIWLLQLHVTAGTASRDEQWFLHWNPGSEPTFGADPRTKHEPTPASPSTTGPTAPVILSPESRILDQVLRATERLQKTGHTFFHRVHVHCHDALNRPPAIIANAAEQAIIPAHKHGTEWPLTMADSPHRSHELHAWGAEWEYTIADQGGACYEYVAAHTNGRLLIVENQGPRVLPAPYLYADDMMLAARDALRFCTRFYRHLGLGEANNVAVRMEWGGMQAYELRSHDENDFLGIPHGSTCKTREIIASDLQCSLAELERDVAGKVEHLVVRTLNMFARYHPPRALYERMIAA